MACAGQPKLPDAAPADLLVARHAAAKQVWEHVERLGLGGPTDLASVEEDRVSWSRRLAESACATGVPRAEAMRQHLARMEAQLESVQDLADAMRRSSFDVAILRFHVADARVMVADVSK